jgi:hypothetical protein
LFSWRQSDPHESFSLRADVSMIMLYF